MDKKKILITSIIMTLICATAVTALLGNTMIIKKELEDQTCTGTNKMYGISNGNIMCSEDLNNATGTTGGNGTITGSGTSGFVPLWNGTNSLNNSIISQNGSKINIDGNLNITGNFTANKITLGLTTSTQTFNINGTIKLEQPSILAWYEGGSARAQMYSDNSDDFYFFSNGRNMYFYGSTGNFISFRTSGKERLLLEGDGDVIIGETQPFIVKNVTGKVGIGTTTPTQALEVNGSMNISGNGNLYLKNIYVNGTPLIDTVSGWEGNYTSIIADISSREINGTGYTKTESDAQQTSINNSIDEIESRVIVIEQTYQSNNYNTYFLNGSYYTGNMNSEPPSTTTAPATDLRAYPVIFGKNLTISSIGMKSASSVSNTSCIVGVYNDTGNIFPDKLLFNMSPTNMGSTSFLSATVNNVKLEKDKIYWFAGKCNTTYARPNAIIQRSVIPILGALQTANSLYTVYTNTSTISNMTMPSVFPLSATRGANVVPIMVYVRVRTDI